MTKTSVSFSQSFFRGLSPEGRVEQMIGHTKISVDCERPAARGRKVFGELVRYDRIQKYESVLKQSRTKK